MCVSKYPCAPRRILEAPPRLSFRRRERDAPDKARADGPTCLHWDSIARGGTTFLIGWLSSPKWESISAVFSMGILLHQSKKRRSFSGAVAWGSSRHVIVLSTLAISRHPRHISPLQTFSTTFQSSAGWLSFHTKPMVRWCTAERPAVMPLRHALPASRYASAKPYCRPAAAKFRSTGLPTIAPLPNVLACPMFRYGLRRPAPDRPRPT
jgi:hypothetical protein